MKSFEVARSAVLLELWAQVFVALGEAEATELVASTLAVVEV